MHQMRVFSIAMLLFLIVTGIQAQDKSDRPSPPKSTKAQLAGGEVVIDYSSPGVKDRVIWGDLVPYDKVWRTGANEATTIMLGGDMKIGGKLIPAGKYALFTIPGEKEWVVILNSQWDQWGAYNYDESKDVHRFTVRPKMVDESEERLKFDIREDGMVTLSWEKLRLSFEVN